MGGQARFRVCRKGLSFDRFSAKELDRATAGDVAQLSRQSREREMQGTYEDCLEAYRRGDYADALT